MNKIFKYFRFAKTKGLYMFLLLFIFALPLTCYSIIPAAIVAMASFLLIIYKLGRK